MLFDKLLNTDGGKNIVYCYSETNRPARRTGRNRKLDVLDDFFLTLVRLRLGVFENHLARVFNISPTVQRLCTTWINYMYLKTTSINIWSSDAIIKETMPESMKVKWIIYAFEIQTERPSSLILQNGKAIYVIFSLSASFAPIRQTARPQAFSDISLGVT